MALWRSGFRSSSDSEFQIAGAATAKARRPYVFSWNLGATSKLRLAERRCCRSATWATGMHSSDKYRALGRIPSSRACTWPFLPHRASAAQHEGPRSYFRVPLTIRAAAFMTRYSLSMSPGWSGQSQDVAVVQSRRYKSMDKRRCRLSVEWTTYSSKLT